MGRNRITKTIDINIDDFEVDIELDTDDLENFDADDLWAAHVANAASSETAEYVLDDVDIRQAVWEAMDDDHKNEARKAWAEAGVDTDDVKVTFDCLSASERVEVTHHVIKSAVEGGADFCKPILETLLAPVPGDDSTRAVLRQFAAECIGGAVGDESILNVHTDPLADIVRALRDRPEPVADVLAALCDAYGAAYTLGQAVQTCVERCSK